MKLLFLDIDGVLNNVKTESKSPEGYVGISNGLLDRLYHIVKATGAKIVLSSSWRRGVQNKEIDGLWLEKKFRQKGMSFFSTTGMQGNHRGKEIRYWLEEHKDLIVEQYAILDDEFVCMFQEQNLIEHLIHTNPSLGLTQELANRTIELLNGKLITKEEYQPWVDEWNGWTVDIHTGKEL